MRTTRSIAAWTLLGTLLAVSAPAAAEPDRAGLAQLFAGRLAARRTTAAIHATDFAGDDIGCIVLPRREIRPYGYPGHAFLCEAAASGEVLGAVLNRKGKRLCYVVGAYADDLCYDIDICGYAERVCVVG